MAKVYVHPTAEVDQRAKLGEGTRVWHQAQVREGAVLGKKCMVGKGSYIDHHVKLGNNVHIQNGVSVYFGVTLEDNAFVGPYASFTNDLYPRSFVPDFKVYKTLIRQGASIGANATIVCGLTIGKYAMIGAGSVVTRSVPDHGFAFGNPAELRGFACFCGRRLIRTGEKGGQVIMACKACGKKVKIPKAIYSTLEDIYK